MNLGRIILKRICKSNYKKIYDKILKADVVSFDIFDTLINRNVLNPSDIFELVEIEFKKLTGRHINNYKKIRCESEMAARQKSDAEEITLNQIFENMRGISENEKEILKKLEIQHELDMTCPNARGIHLYKYALRNNKKIIIVSDMYLDEKIVKRILNKNGITIYEKLYLSSTFGESKYSGTLYEHLMEDLMIKPQCILHIGDNIMSDFMQPKKFGIKACLMPQSSSSLKYWKKRHNINRSNEIQYSVLKAFLINNILDEQHNKENDVSKRIGFEVLGPILAGYSVWLNKEIDKNNIDKVFFLAREGKILQQAYNMIYSSSTIKQCYLSISRHAVLIPLLSLARNFDELIECIKTLMKSSQLKVVRIICALEKNEFKNRLREIGLTEADSIHNIKNKEQVFKIIQDLGHEKFEEQRELIKEYLKQNAFDGNIAISDIGWLGTMQKALQNLLNDNADLHIKGFYIGVRNILEKEKYKDLNRYGYLFNPQKNIEFDYMTRLTTEILEMLFLNGDGSVLGYQKNGAKIEPIVAEKEYNGESLLFIQSIQNEAMRFIKLFADNLKILNLLQIEPEVVFEGYVNFAVYPSMKTINVFSKFNFRNEITKPVVPSESIFYYMFHIKKLVNDLSEYCSIFMLKKLFVLPFPYYKFSRFMIEKIGIKSEYRKGILGNGPRT